MAYLRGGVLRYLVSDAKCGLLLIVCAQTETEATRRGAPRGRNIAEPGASELSTPTHLLRGEEAGSLTLPLLTCRLAFSPWNVTPEDRWTLQYCPPLPHWLAPWLVVSRPSPPTG